MQHFSKKWAAFYLVMLIICAASSILMLVAFFTSNILSGYGGDVFVWHNDGIVGDPMDTFPILEMIAVIIGPAATMAGIVPLSIQLAGLSKFERRPYRRITLGLIMSAFTFVSFGLMAGNTDEEVIFTLYGAPTLSVIGIVTALSGIGVAINMVSGKFNYFAEKEIAGDLSNDSFGRYIPYKNEDEHGNTELSAGTEDLSGYV